MTNELVKSEFQLLDRDDLTDGFKKIKAFQITVKKLLVKGLDYGVIPGCGDKAVLLKPGADKLVKMHHLSDEYQILNQIEDWDKKLFRYVVKCSLRMMGSPHLVSEGLGECNAFESKYRYRWVSERDLTDTDDKTQLKSKTKMSKNGEKYKQYRIENDDIFSQINTILKMAKKRAFIDAALSATRLSSIFTQDLIDDDNVSGKNSNVKSEDEKKPDAIEQKSDSNEMFCDNCGVELTQKVYDFAMQKFNRSLCYNCQKAQK